VFLRARASIARISYGNSVLVSVRLSVPVSVTSRYRSKPRWDKVFWFSRYGVFSVLWQNFTLLDLGGFHKREGERKALTLKRRYFAAIGSSAVKWLQIGPDMLLIITNAGDELLRNVKIDDLKW